MEPLQNISGKAGARIEIDLVLDSEGRSTVEVDGKHYPAHVISDGQVIAEIEVDAVVINAIGMVGSVTYGAVSPIVEFRCHGRASLGHGLLCPEQRCYVHSCRRVSANRRVLILRRLINSADVWVKQFPK